ncbi:MULTISPECIES: EAL domain-containing protein [Vibrio]|uniref:EAL domain-containing protein n=1 Tax=Vibrio TaxID=662 RepID=UPI00142EB18B|nr:MULTISPECIES: EAL domain-containing protein [Vibrio]
MSEPKIGKKFLWITFIVPLFVFAIGASIIANILIFKDLKSIAKHYVTEVDQIIDDRIRENKLALKNKNRCELIQQELLFESVVRELRIIENRVSICSSKQGEQHENLSQYVPSRDIRSGAYLFDLEGDPEQRTLVVVNRLPENPRVGAFAVVDRNYIAARMAKSLSDTIDQVYGTFGKLTYPANVDEVDGYFKVLGSERFNYSVTVEATNTYVVRQYALLLLGSLPLSLLISGAFIYASRRFKNHNSLVDDIKRGLHRGEFFMVYQPIVSHDQATNDTQEGNQVHANRVAGLEALIRWQHPKLGLVRPDLFIPLAEQHGLINKLTDYVFGQVISDLNGLELCKGSQYHVGINIPPSYLASKNCMFKLEQYYHCFDDTPWKPTIEVTERQLLDSDSQRVLQKAREMGFKVSIDDFGTGHTSLAVLQKIQFDYLKIDKCFVDTVGVDAVNSPVLLTIIELAHKLGVEIVAEGVETQEQQAFLESHRCQHLQGYLFYKPLTLSEVSKVLEKQPQ